MLLHATPLSVGYAYLFAWLDDGSSDASDAAQCAGWINGSAAAAAAPLSALAQWKGRIDYVRLRSRSHTAPAAPSAVPRTAHHH